LIDVQEIFSSPEYKALEDPNDGPKLYIETKVMDLQGRGGVFVGLEDVFVSLAPFQ
jgi:hypothetical protein